MRPADRPTRLALALLVASAAWAGPSEGDEPDLPTPPRQAEAWTPPRTTLPRFLASTTAALCEQGLADPRGCDYRTIRIAIGDGGDGAGELATAGWVLPVVAGRSIRHAIAWNGLIYPLIGGDAPADLDGDVRRLESIATVGGQAGGAFRFRGFRGGVIDTEATSVRLDVYQPIKVCLLLRFGRADLAERLWAAGLRGQNGVGTPPADGKLDLRSYGVSYLTLARELAGYRYDRAISAHLRGDDGLALLEARGVQAMSRAIEARSEAMGFDRPNTNNADGLAPYLDFLGRLPILIADQERRARERSDPGPRPKGEGPVARTAGLIRDLDQVRNGPPSAFGGDAPSQPEVVQTLVAEGDAAFEPLLWAFRTDDRLTRAIDGLRTTGRHRGVRTVADVAYTALLSILKADRNELPNLDPTKESREDRKVIADQVERYWRANRTIPVVERRYRTLLDDKAGGPAWLEAAGHIVAPDTAAPNPGGARIGPPRSAIPGLKPPRPFLGESLREHHEPTVASLMIRRSRSMLKGPAGFGSGLAASCRMAAILAEWDPIAALPTLRELTRICRERCARPEVARSTDGHDLAGWIVRFSNVRDEVGDAGVAREYAGWLRTIDPSWLDPDLAGLLGPILRRPEDPDLLAAADWLLGDPKSPIVPLLGGGGSKPDFRVSSLASTPLLKLPAVRAMLLRMLEDRSAVGTATPLESEFVSAQIGNFSIGRSGPKDDADPPPAGLGTPIRLADFYAWQVSAVEGAPTFHPCWPEPRKDAAIAGIAEYLRAKAGH